MKTVKCFVVTLVVAGGMSNVAPAHAPTPVRMVWAPLPGAVYYRGDLVSGSSTLKVQTSSTWLLVPPGSVLDVSGYDGADQKVEGHVQPRLIDPSPPVSEVQVRPSNESPAIGPDWRSLKELPPAPKAPAPSPKHRPKRSVRPKSNLREPIDPVVTLGAGLGREELRAKAGIYSYSGRSNVAPIAFGVAWPIHRGPWVVDFEGRLHHFNVNSVVESIDGGDPEETTQRLVRSEVWLGARYHILRGTISGMSHDLHVGLGVSHVQAPMMAVTDQASGQAGLRNQASLRLGVQSHYRLFWSKSLGLLLSARYAPVSLQNGVKAEGGRFGLAGVYRVTHRGDLNLGVAYGQEDLGRSSSCAEGVSCPGRATARLQLVTVEVGYTQRI